MQGAGRIIGRIRWRGCGARPAFHRRAAPGDTRHIDQCRQKRAPSRAKKARGGRRGTRAARRRAAARARAGAGAGAAAAKAADDGAPAITPPHVRATAGGLAAAGATAERDSTTRADIAACLFAAPHTDAPRVARIDARPTIGTRPTIAITAIAGREARMHERKGLAGQGGHAPPGTSAALKRCLYLGRPKTGATAG